MKLSMLKNKLYAIEPLTFLVINLKRLRHASHRRNLQSIVSAVAQETGKSKTAIYWDMLVKCACSCALYIDYTTFQFYKRPLSEVRLFFTHGRAARVLREMKPPAIARMFDFKPLFNEVFAKFVKREWLYITENTTQQQFESFLQKHPVVVAKPVGSNQGRGVWLADSTLYPDKTELFALLRQRGTPLIEERIYNHSELDKFSATSLNTIRIITLKLPEGVKIIRAFLKFNLSGDITDNSHNLSFYCPLDFETGEIIGDIVDQNTKKNFGELHPSGFRARGLKIPYWEQVVALAKECTLFLDEVYLGPWDIAVTNDGPIIIEGNVIPSFAFQGSMNYPLNHDMQRARKFAQKYRRQKKKDAE